MTCKKCKKEKPVRATDDLCWECHEELQSLLKYYEKLWLAGGIIVDRELLGLEFPDRTGEPF